MKCSRIQRKLSAYLDGEVSEPEKRTIAKHLRSCPECQHALQALSAVEDTLRQVPAMEVPPYFYTRLEQRIRDQESTLHVLEKIRRFALPGFATVLTFASLLFGNIMAKTIYQSIAEPETTTETANVFGIDAFDEYPEGSISNFYNELVSGGE